MSVTVEEKAAQGQRYLIVSELVIQGNKPVSKTWRASTSLEYFPEIQKSNEGFLNVVAEVKRQARDMHLEVRDQRAVENEWPPSH